MGSPKQNETPQKRKIKVIIESIHSPSTEQGDNGYSQELIEGTFITQSTFNESGLIIKEEKFETNGRPEWRTDFRYNKSGQLVGKRLFRFDKINSESKYNYDADHGLVEVVEEDASGKIVNKQTSQFDSMGYEVTSWQLSGGRFVQNAKSYFGNGGYHLWTTTFSNGRPVSRETHRYNDDGRVAETNLFYPVTEQQKTILYKYDSSGNNSETLVLNNNLMIQSRIVSSFDSGGNLLKRTSFDLTGKVKDLTSHAYQFDTEGNIIRDVTFSGRRPVSVLVRQIEYY